MLVVLLGIDFGGKKPLEEAEVHGNGDGQNDRGGSSGLGARCLKTEAWRIGLGREARAGSRTMKYRSTERGLIRDQSDRSALEMWRRQQSSSGLPFAWLGSQRRAPDAGVEARLLPLLFTQRPGQSGHQRQGQAR